MMKKNLILSLLCFILLLASISAYNLQIPLCNPPILNDSCLNYTNISSITNDSTSGIIYFKDGYLYLTNETLVNYTIVYNYTNITNNITNITYNVTNITYVNNYNITNGSNLTIVQNISANETIIRDWVNSKLNASIFNSSFYNKSDADFIFISKAELNSRLLSYPTITAMDSKYAYLLAINTSGMNGTISLNSTEDTGFTMTWKVIIVICCVLIILVMLMVVKLMMDG